MQSEVYLSLQRGSPLQIKLAFTDENGVVRSVSVPLTDQQALELANSIVIEIGATIGQARLQQTAQADTAFLTALGVSPQ